MQKFVFGMPTLIELSNIEECVAVCKDLGLHFIEINMNMPQYQIGIIDIKSLKKAYDCGIFFTFHLDENFNIADFNNEITNGYLCTIQLTIDIAKMLNVSVINMHMAEGVHFKLPNGKIYLFEKYNDFYMNSLKKFKDYCIEWVTGSRIKICIENCSGYLPFQIKGIEYLLESDVFQLTYDIGHCYCAKNIDEQFIMENKKRVYHMHIHDAHGDKCHLVLGSGNIDLKEKLSLAKSQNCYCVVETKSLSGLRESIKYLQNL